jgi:hypothetical protein
VRRRAPEIIDHNATRPLWPEIQSRQSASDLGKLQLEKRHSSINASKLLLGIKSVFDEFTAELNESEKDHLNVRSHDNIRDSIDQIAESRVGDPPSQNELDEIYKEGKSRYENQIPPGYSDTRKAKEVPAQFSTHGLRIERQFGDLILWKQLIKLASTQSLKHLILVTDDEKEDWWLTIDSLGKKTIGPRPELLEEMMDNTSLEDFYIYNSETFLQNAKKYLLAEVKEQSIDEVRMVRQEQNAKSKWESFTRPAVDAAYLWLKGRHPGLAAKVNDAEWEISFEDSTGIVAAYQIYCLSGADSVSQVDFIFDSIRGASSTPSILALRQFGSVIVLEDRNHYGYLEPWIRDVILQSNMSLTIGELHRASDGAASFSPFWSKRVEAR